ncbi:MAG: ABC transporter ATP-binding protein [Gammaproteobacteria bacterium]|jgi:iron complex transport system ATP-binding protein|nr:ABC transporter ATP-binding protein [Gammaproteobacteria bacterium]
MNPLLETRNLQVRIAQQTVCQDLNIALLPGQCWAILGINGAGKTTLLHSLAGLRAAQGGEVVVQQRPLPDYPRRELAQRLGLLFQDIQDPFPSTVMETALMGRHPYTKAWQWENANDYRIATEALTQVGLHTLAQRQINTLSGGERQRLAIATLLTQAPRLLLLDEPTNHLDLQYQHHILKLFKQYAQEHACAVVMILHDINLAALYCDHAILLHADAEPQCGASEVLLTEENLTGLYHYPIRKIAGPDNQPVFIAS